jgi:hypothetical protein
MTMKRKLAGLVIASLMVAGAAHAQSEKESGSTAAKRAAQAAPAHVEAAAHADGQAGAAIDPQVQQQLDEIKQKGEKTSVKSRAKAEAKLEAAAQKVDHEAADQGDARIASRLSSEFGMTADAILEEKAQLGVSWGEWMIAHTLAANASGNVTVEDLVALRSEGTGWGQIAAGLGLRLGEVVSAVMSEGRVADGAAKADGKVAVIHGEGARAGLGANAGVGAGMRAGGASAAVHAGLGGRVGH